MKKQIVEVVWIDSMSAGGWRNKHDALNLFGETPLMHSTGYLFKKNKKKIALVGSIDGANGSVNHYHEIPMSAVRSIRKVR